MKEYIEREAVVKLLKAACKECREACEEFDGFYADCNQCIMHIVVNGVPSIPAADVVPVVRCGECRYWNRSISDDGSVEYFNFSHCEKGHNGFPTFFCADGARKDGDGE